LLIIFLKNYNPILKITKNVKKFGDGDLSVEFPKNGIKEIDELSETLNYVKEEFVKTNELKRDLLANVSHDLKTPLTMIKAYAEMVKDYTYKNKVKRNENLNIIISETDRLNLLVNDILDLSKLQANKEELKLEEFDIILEIKSILKRYDLLVEKENYHISFEGPESVFVTADKSKINQVIYNLINNAINYTGKDKIVIIKVSVVNNKVLVEVKDTGKGIDESEKKYIWDKYYKTNKNYKRSKISSGIGLSIVKEILTYHQFEYGFNSIKNQGTTFYFYINM
jgi:signal transduction histidine kinase